MLSNNILLPTWLRAMLLHGAALLFLAPAVQAETLTVAVAANVKYAFAELQQAFAKESGVEVKGVVGASGQLSAQIKSGAPLDVFLSADMDYPEALYRDNAAVTAPKVYAQGVLVLWTTRALDLSKGMQVLNDPAVHKIALANPQLAPYGREALRALDYYKLRAAVEPKLVYGESISQVSQYIDTGAVDIGFTAKSVVVAPVVHGRGRWVEVPKESYQPIAQGVVILKHAAENGQTAARRFVEFLSSRAARAILERYGYVLP